MGYHKKNYKIDRGVKLTTDMLQIFWNWSMITKDISRHMIVQYAAEYGPKPHEVSMANKIQIFCSNNYESLDDLIIGVENFIMHREVIDIQQSSSAIRIRSESLDTQNTEYNGVTGAYDRHVRIESNDQVLNIVTITVIYVE